MMADGRPKGGTKEEEQEKKQPGRATRQQPEAKDAVMGKSQLPFWVVGMACRAGGRPVMLLSSSFLFAVGHSRQSRPASAGLASKANQQ